MSAPPKKLPQKKLPQKKLRRPVPLRMRLVTSVGSGLVAVVAGARLGLAESALIGFAAAGVVFVGFGWRELWRLNWEETKEFAEPLDGDRTVDDMFVVGIALASLGIIADLLVTGHSVAGSWPAAVAVLDVAAAWASLHLMYAGRYARLYYSTDDDPRKPGGIDFNDTEHPSYKDFLYFSYNLGMTYQVSDTAVTSPEIRRVVLFHCLLSYVFGTAILATTINLVLGALSG